MTISWVDLRKKPFKLQNEPIEAPWLMVVEAFEDFDHLQITSEGTWPAYPGLPLECGPDGISASPIAAEQRLIADCRLGALIGKLGGSSAMLDIPSGESSGLGMFALGTNALVKVPSGCFGPLFIGFNVKARPISIANLSVTVRGAKLMPTIA
jgi:hypothetical protein